MRSSPCSRPLPTGASRRPKRCAPRFPRPAIAGHLAALAGAGESAAIDFRSLPLTAADRGALEGLLGRGEVSAKLDVAGTSELWETRYSGVWWVRHRGDDERIASERIEIAPIPEILVSHEADIAVAAARIREEVEPYGRA